MFWITNAQHLSMINFRYQIKLLSISLIKRFMALRSETHHFILNYYLN